MRVFLDTNVLVGAVISRGLCQDLLRTLLEEHEVVVSRLVIEEFVRVLRDKLGAPQSSVNEALLIFDAVEGTTDPSVPHEAGNLDVSDATILAAAAEARAEVFVTGDHELLVTAKDLPVPVLSPRRFMDLLRAHGEPYPAPTDDEPPRVSDGDTAATTVRDRSYDFALAIVHLCRQLEQEHQYVLARQLLRSGTSVGANIEEAGAAASRKDFLHKMTIASKEARESNYWLRLIKDSEIAPNIDLDPYLATSSKLVRLLTAIVKTTAKTTC